MPFEEVKARSARVWSSAPWENVEDTLAPVHEHLLRVLAPGPGLRLLDLATGTGAVARRAARTGADVTGADFAPGLVETARRLAAEEQLDVQFDVADAEQLPYEDGSFDAVASSMGVIFAPDHARAAAELARVTTRGGTIAFSAWRNGPPLAAVTRKYMPPPAPGQGDSDDWAREEYARDLLGDAFDLRFEDGDCPIVGRSGEEFWQLLISSSGPAKARYESLDPERAEQLHREAVAFAERYRVDRGIRVPGPYVVVVGVRR